MQNFISISGLEQINPYNILAPDRYMAIFWLWRAQLKHLSKICCKIELKILNDVGAEKYWQFHDFVPWFYLQIFLFLIQS